MTTNTSPFPSWTLVTVVDKDGKEISYWDSPKPAPAVHGKVFYWDESKLDWVEVE